jgi:hypothetical protein
LLLALLAPPQDAAPASRPAAPTADEVRTSIDRGVQYLLGAQNKNGSFGGIRNHTFTDSFGNAQTHDCWIIGTSGLSAMALLECARKEEARDALDRVTDFLTTRGKVQRPDGWDIDNVWAFVFGLEAAARLLSSGRYAGTPREAALKKAAADYVDGLDRYQSPNGGWAYYANPDSAWRPEWATSFTTAAGALGRPVL